MDTNGLRICATRLMRKKKRQEMEERKEGRRGLDVVIKVFLGIIG